MGDKSMQEMSGMPVQDSEPNLAKSEEMGFNTDKPEQFQSPDRFEAQEISGGQWDRAKGTYTVEKDGITTEYRFIRHPLLAQIATIQIATYRLVSTPDGKTTKVSVKFDKKEGTWIDKGPLDEIADTARKVVAPDKTGYIVTIPAREAGGKSTHRLVLMNVMTPIVPEMPEARVPSAVVISPGISTA